MKIELMKNVTTKELSDIHEVAKLCNNLYSCPRCNNRLKFNKINPILDHDYLSLDVSCNNDKCDYTSSFNMKLNGVWNSYYRHMITIDNDRTSTIETHFFDDTYADPDDEVVIATTIVPYS